MTDAPRAYESPVRRERAAQTRDRILAAGAALVHSFTKWDWSELTVRGVAERAGVAERTVYRHFATERELRDAILARLQEEAGVSVDGLELSDFAATTARVVSYLSTFAIEPKVLTDPTFVAIDQQRREALVQALESRTLEWSEQDRTLAASLLDVFWSVPTYERMRSTWELSHDDIGRAIGWVIGLIEAAITEGDTPG